MTDDGTFQQLTAALRDRLALIGDRALRERDPAAQLAGLQEASERIGRLQAALPQPIHPQLAHFLQRCSYDKALEWLETAGRDNP